jgi:hypothetical protein
MNTGAKIAIGCGVAVVVTGIAAVVGVVGLGYWAKGKAEKAFGDMAGDQKKIEQLQETANKNDFTPPADGTITEARLQKFLEVRKHIFDVYKAHEADIEAMKNKKDASIGDAMKGVGIINEVRLARAQGLADAGMSESEYQYYVGSIYTSAVATEVNKATGGKKVSEAVRDASNQAAKVLEQQANATPDPNLPPEAQKAQRMAADMARKQLEEMRKQTDETVAEAQKADVPEANVELFKKYEGDIKKYAMGGLEYVGL